LFLLKRFINRHKKDVGHKRLVIFIAYLKHMTDIQMRIHITIAIQKKGCTYVNMKCTKVDHKTQYMNHKQNIPLHFDRTIRQKS